uniref:Thiamine transporter 2 n=1 Tax=Panagrolaimus davidi TaxID=227884 RepID=A0A914PI15_9BILA
MKWWIIAGILCLFGISKEFRPMEPYLYNYQHENLNISDSDLNGQIYPIWTYSYLIALIPSLLLTDVFLYKPVLIFESICYISVWITLIFYKSIFSQQLGQFFFGFATATEVAYFAYIYVKVDRKKFSKVTAWTRAALLAGKCSSYFISEFFVLFHWGNLQTLNYISISSLFIALILSIFLPNVSWKSIVNRSVEYQTSTLSTPTPPEIIPHNYISFAINHVKNFKQQVCKIYADWKVLKWSFWWAMATCGELQIGNYTQTLWGQLQDSSGKDTLNGFIEAACPFKNTKR